MTLNSRLVLAAVQMLGQVPFGLRPVGSRNSAAGGIWRRFRSTSALFRHCALALLVQQPGGPSWLPYYMASGATGSEWAQLFRTELLGRECVCLASGPPETRETKRASSPAHVTPVVLKCGFPSAQMKSSFKSQRPACRSCSSGTSWSSFNRGLHPQPSNRTMRSSFQPQMAVVGNHLNSARGEEVLSRDTSPSSVYPPGARGTCPQASATGFERLGTSFRQAELNLVSRSCHRLRSRQGPV